MLEYLAFDWSNILINYESNALQYIYFRSLKDLKYIKQHRVNVIVQKPPQPDGSNINAYSDYHNNRFWINPLHLSKSIINVASVYDTSKYLSLSRSEKFFLQANIMHDSLEFLFGQLGLNFDRIKGLKEDIISSDMSIELPAQIKKNKRHASYKAELIIKPDLYSFEYCLHIYEAGVTTRIFCSKDILYTSCI